MAASGKSFSLHVAKRNATLTCEHFVNDIATRKKMETTVPHDIMPLPSTSGKETRLDEARKKVEDMMRKQRQRNSKLEEVHDAPPDVTPDLAQVSALPDSEPADTPNKNHPTFIELDLDDDLLDPLFLSDEEEINDDEPSIVPQELCISVSAASSIILNSSSSCNNDAYNSAFRFTSSSSQYDESSQMSIKSFVTLEPVVASVESHRMSLGSTHRVISPLATVRVHNRSDPRWLIASSNDGDDLSPDRLIDSNSNNGLDSSNNYQENMEMTVSITDAIPEDTFVLSIDGIIPSDTRPFHDFQDVFGKSPSTLESPLLISSKSPLAQDFTLIYKSETTVADKIPQMNSPNSSDTELVVPRLIRSELDGSNSPSEVSKPKSKLAESDAATLVDVKELSLNVAGDFMLELQEPLTQFDLTLKSGPHNSLKSEVPILEASLANTSSLGLTETINLRLHPVDNRNQSEYACESQNAENDAKNKPVESSVSMSIPQNTECDSNGCDCQDFNSSFSVSNAEKITSLMIVSSLNNLENAQEPTDEVKRDLNSMQPQDLHLKLLPSEPAIDLNNIPNGKTISIAGSSVLLNNESHGETFLPKAAFESAECDESFKDKTTNAESFKNSEEIGDFDQVLKDDTIDAEFPECSEEITELEMNELEMNELDELDGFDELDDFDDGDGLEFDANEDIDQITDLDNISDVDEAGHFDEASDNLDRFHNRFIEDEIIHDNANNKAPGKKSAFDDSPAQATTLHNITLGYNHSMNEVEESITQHLMQGQDVMPHIPHTFQNPFPLPTKIISELPGVTELIRKERSAPAVSPLKFQYDLLDDLFDVPLDQDDLCDVKNDRNGATVEVVPEVKPISGALAFFTSLMGGKNVVSQTSNVPPISTGSRIDQTKHTELPSQEDTHKRLMVNETRQEMHLPATYDHSTLSELHKLSAPARFQNVRNAENVPEKIDGEVNSMACNTDFESTVELVDLNNGEQNKPTAYKELQESSFSGHEVVRERMEFIPIEGSEYSNSKPHEDSTINSLHLNFEPQNMGARPYTCGDFDPTDEMMLKNFTMSPSNAAAESFDQKNTEPVLTEFANLDICTPCKCPSAYEPEPIVRPSLSSSSVEDFLANLAASDPGQERNYTASIPSSASHDVSLLKHQINSQNEIIRNLKEEVADMKVERMDLLGRIRRLEQVISNDLDGGVSLSLCNEAEPLETQHPTYDLPVSVLLTMYMQNSYAAPGQLDVSEVKTGDFSALLMAWKGWQMDLRNW